MIEDHAAFLPLLSYVLSVISCGVRSFGHNNGSMWSSIGKKTPNHGLASSKHPFQED
jgi:hypothetical protein